MGLAKADTPAESQGSIVEAIASVHAFSSHGVSMGI
jgi:hypothetical protein